MSFVTTHVLDVSSGQPAEGIEVELLALPDGAEHALDRGTTDADGRIGSLGPDSLSGGAYRLRFHVGAYFDRHRLPTLFPIITVDFLVGDDSGPHLHIPVLVSPFAYSTYRGS
jgi:5-hydroxyisourate hydrolase